MRYGEYDTDLLMAARVKLQSAFRDLRRRGIKARANFWCCQGCGNSAMSAMFKPEDVGGTFWHQQDDEGFRKHGYLHLAFFINAGKEKIDEDSAADLVGHMIVDALVENGLDVRWSGSSNQRICVYAEGARAQEEKKERARA